MGRFDGKAAIVTGAGSGIGRAWRPGSSPRVRRSSPYAISKGGVVQLTRALAVEFLKRPLRVNAIAPAGTNADIATQATFPPDVDLDLLGRMSGARGLSEPEEVAGLFAFLASDEARSVTGAVYTIDNGLTAS